MPDVVVIGGSVAGAATATHLARRGLDVLVLEQSAKAARKACGEGVFPAGVVALERLGAAEPLALTGHPLQGVQFVAGSHAATARFADGKHGLGLARPGLDEAVRAAAMKAGVEFAFGVRAEGLRGHEGRVTAVRTNTGEFEARVFVAADGLGSRFRRLARLEGGQPGDRYGVSAHVAVDDDPGPYVRVFFEDRYEIYLTPVGPKLLNVAVLTRRPEMQAFRGGTTGAFQALLSRTNASELRGAELVDEPIAAGPFPRGCRRSWRGNFVLTGDAAGFLDGITGEGISTALRSAELCADAVAQHLNNESAAPFREYERQRRRLVRNSDNLGRLSLLLSASPALARWSVRNLERRPATFERLLAVSSGEAKATALRPRDLSALLTGI